MELAARLIRGRHRTHTLGAEAAAALRGALGRLEGLVDLGEVTGALRAAGSDALSRAAE